MGKRLEQEIPVTTLVAIGLISCSHFLPLRDKSTAWYPCDSSFHNRDSRAPFFR